MTKIRLTENQIAECGYDLNEFDNGETYNCVVRKCTYWDTHSDQLITVIEIERL